MRNLWNISFPTWSHPLMIIAALLIGQPAAAQIFSKEVPAASGSKLRLDLETGGSLTIEGWDQDVVSVKVSGKASSNLEFVTERRGNTVFVTSELKQKRRRWSSSLKFKISVPRAMDIDIDSTGGGISIRGVEGRFEGRTMGGEIKLFDLRGDADLETMGGDILVADSELDGKVSTMGGEVTMRDLFGNLDGSSMGGNVSIERVTRRDGDSTGDAVIISTMGGTIEVEDAPAGAKLRTMGGQIKVTSAREYVDAETMGGNIRLRNVDGWVEALTMGGDVEVKVVGDGNNDAHIELQSMSGDIHLTVPSDLGFQVDLEIAYTKGRVGKHEIQTELPLEFSETDKWDLSHGSARRYLRAVGKIGNGEHVLKIRTVNGNVVLKQDS